MFINKKNLNFLLKDVRTISNKARNVSGRLLSKFNSYLPGWSLPFIYTILLFLLGYAFNKYTGINLFELINNKLFIIVIVCFFNLLNIWHLSYYSISLYLIYLLVNNRFIKPNNLPSFLSNWIDHLDKITKFENSSIFINYYIKSLLIHFVLLIVSIFGSFYFFYLI